MRPLSEQVAGLDRVARAASRLHRINLAIDAPGRDGLAVLHGQRHAERTELVYVVGGYDLWHHGDLIQTDLTEDEAAVAMASIYMDAKAWSVLRTTYSLTEAETNAVLADPARRDWFYGEMDKGSDVARASLTN